MSLLHQESGEEIDDALRGESFTKGSSHVVLAGLIAAVLVTIAIAIYVLAGEKPPVASGEIVQVWAHPRHVETSGLDANGAPMPRESFDQLLVFAHVKLRNQSEVPLFLENVRANVTRADGTLSISAGSVAQFQEVFLAYPELAVPHANPLSPHMTLAPGESVDGTVFWAMQMTRQQWDARKNLDFTFIFQYQSSLVLAPRTAVIEQ
jgi:hypothetical protein